MGTWNYRVMKRGDKVAIYEVYYGDNGNVKGYTANSIAPQGNDMDDLENTARVKVVVA
ncbi:hypothetical protein SAMN05518865_112197 [Duganella sp. CF458]|uniref:hypothetical protein n=1 Tax=Duganella sp. CF458 TaxID=1884368 RepID=UPI0008E11969|nr:hypothetical protein [Duganella sp. CF458]SFG47028.1 hypothetical protein SAMN05518865_112197 [Duganella sp. CF458]